MRQGGVITLIPIKPTMPVDIRILATTPKPGR